jgi:hypothetical protein
MLTLLIPFGSAAAQDDLCAQAGGMPDPATGKCVLRGSVEININYPAAELAGADSARFAIDNYLRELQDEFMDSFVDNLPQYTGFAPWSLVVDYRVYRRPGISLGVVLIISDYRGGANPNGYWKTFLFSETDGSALRLADLFQPGSNPYAVLAQVVPARIQQQYGDMVDAGWVYDGTGEDPLNYQHYALTPDSLLFFFDEYQVGPGALGPVEVMVPLAELGSIIAPALR